MSQLRSLNAGMNSTKAFTNLVLCGLHIKVRLQIHPELRGLGKIFAKSEGDISGYRPGTVNDMTNPHRRYANIMCQLYLRDAEFLYHISKYYTRMHRLKISSHHTPPNLVIIGYLNIMRTICIKSKTDALLIINTNTPLSFAFARKHFKTIRGRKPQILDSYSSIKLCQLNERPRLNIMRQLTRPHTLKQSLSFFTGKRLYHKESINKLFISCQMAEGENE